VLASEVRPTIAVELSCYDVAVVTADTPIQGNGLQTVVLEYPLIEVFLFYVRVCTS
jgi:hypothetical protein